MIGKVFKVYRTNYHMYYGAYQRFLMSPFNSNDLDFHLVFISFVSPDGKTLVLVNPQAISLHSNVLEYNNPHDQKWEGLYLTMKNSPLPFLEA